MKIFYFHNLKNFCKLHGRVFIMEQYNVMVKIGNDQEMSRLMGKPTVFIGENKDADQLRGYRTLFSLLGKYNSSSTYLQNFKLLACFCSCTVWFVSDLFGNHIVGFPTRRLKWRVRNDWEPAQAELNFHHIHRTVTM